MSSFFPRHPTAFQLEDVTDLRKLSLSLAVPAVASAASVTEEFDFNNTYAAKQAASPPLSVLGPGANTFVKENVDGAGLRFVLSDPNKSTGRARVVYHGSVPDLYRVGRVVVVSGTLRNGTFDGTVLSTKCPSKYTPAKSSSTT